MEVDRCTVTSDHLTDGHSFVLCDARVSGFPIRYASSGFKAMFHYADGETPARTERLSGCSCLADSEAAVAAAGGAAGLSAQDVVSALQLLEDIAAERCQQIAGGEADDASSVLLVKARRGGEMFVCELSLQLVRHPQTDWSFLVGLHKDVVRQLSVRELLQAAALGAQPVRTLLGGLIKRTGRQDTLLVHPQSVAHLHEAFDKVWRGFLSGLGSKGSKAGDGGKHQPGGKHRKQKTMRSEVSGVSAATTASHVSIARSSKSNGEKASAATAASTATTSTTAPPSSAASAAASAASSSAALAAAPAAKQARELKWKPEAVERGSEHLLDLLEEAGANENSPARSARKPNWRRAVSTEQVSPDGEPNPVCKKELCELSVPFALFDPSQPGTPAVVCSAPLARLMDRTVCDGMIEGLALSGLLESLEEAEECRSLCEAAMQGMYHRSGRCPYGLAKKGSKIAQLLPEGELTCVDTSMQPRECMVHLKQVELDDRMYVVGLWARIPNDAEAKQLFQQENLLPTSEEAGWPSSRQEDRRLLAFLCLDEHMDSLVQVLASHFWFSAPMRRQTAIGEMVT